MKRVLRITVCAIFSFVVATPGPLSAQGKDPDDIQKSCRNFVKQFYDWYVPEAVKEDTGSVWDLALEHKSYAFSHQLLRQLKEDSEAQAKVEGEIVGLDFDPFLNSQDVDEGYVTGKVTRKGGSCWVEVYGTRSGRRSRQHVGPGLKLKNGHWLFVNFHYPNASRREFENLLSQLKSLRDQRQRPR